MLEKIMKEIDATLIPKFDDKINDGVKSVIKEIKKQFRGMSDEISDLKRDVAALSKEVRGK